MTSPYPEMHYPAREWLPAPAPKPDTPSAGIATAALVVSTLSLLVAMVPFLGTPVWASGLALSFVAISRLQKRERGRARAFVGLGVAVISGSLSLLMSVLVFFAVITKHDPKCAQSYEAAGTASTVCGPR
jgi:hypothetical protein